MTPRRGGDVFVALDRRYEVIFGEAETRVHCYDLDGRPVDLAGSRGSVEVVSATGGGRRAELAPVEDPAGGAGWLAARVPLGDAVPGKTRVLLSLRDLPSTEEPELDLVRTFRGFGSPAAEAHEGHH